MSEPVACDRAMIATHRGKVLLEVGARGEREPVAFTVLDPDEAETLARGLFRAKRYIEKCGQRR